MFEVTVESIVAPLAKIKKKLEVFIELKEDEIEEGRQQIENVEKLNSARRHESLQAITVASNLKKMLGE